MSIPVGSNNIHLKNTYINFTAKATYAIYLLIVFLIINAKMSKVTKNGFSHFRRGFEAFHKSRHPTDFEKISHIYTIIHTYVCVLGLSSMQHLLKTNHT